MDKKVELEVVSVFGGEDRKAALHFGEYIENKEFSVKSLYDFLREYIDHIYGEEDAPILFHPTGIE